MRASLLVPALLVIATLPRHAPAQDLTGTWTLSVTLDAGSGDATFTFTQQGDSLTGTYTGALGESKVTGSAKDGIVEFSFESQAGRITYRGKVTGDTIEGTCTYGQLGTGTFKGKKTA